jgi:hypothetical protein
VRTKEFLMKHLLRMTSLLLAGLMLSGCVVIAVADTAATAVVKTGGLVVDGAVGAAKITGKAVGAAADLVIPDGEEKK